MGKSERPAPTNTASNTNATNIASNTNATSTTTNAPSNTNATSTNETSPRREPETKAASPMADPPGGGAVANDTGKNGGVENGSGKRGGDDGAAPADDTLARRKRDLDGKEEALKLDERERDLRARRAQFEKAAGDRRDELLAAVRVSAPNLDGKLFDTLKPAELGKRGFTAADATTLFDLKAVELDKPQEFFDLDSAKREDLLDRVGFYRGIVIDHGQSDQIQPGFRDILKRPSSADGATPSSKRENVTARVYYRKPPYSGNFENSFTSSEVVHQAQKSGVTNLKCALAASGGVATTASLGVAAAYAGRSASSDTTASKNIYITSNFYIPKIELSFGFEEPCASDDFVDAIERALSKGPLSERFAALKGVLDRFGHFVATQTLVGGRLFATDKRSNAGAEDADDVSQRFAAEVKASLSAPVVKAEASASAERSTQSASQGSSGDEEQEMVFQAVGGEGGVIRDAATWVRSLFDYQRWSAVQRENLVPSISLLPRDLPDRCWSTLTDYANGKTKAHLLFEDEAYFMFYGEYADRAGQCASETYFRLYNVAKGEVLECSQGDGARQLLELSAPGPYDNQLWYMTPDSQIVSFATKTLGALGPRRPIEFALTVDARAPDYPVNVQQRGRADNQHWEYTGSGSLRSIELDRILTVNGGRVLASPAEKAETPAWSVLEVSADEVAIAGSKAGRLNLKPDPGTPFALRLPGCDMALGVQNGELDRAITSGAEPAVIVMPYDGSPHQCWQMSVDGTIQSLCTAATATTGGPLLLSVESGGSKLLVRPDDQKLNQRWTLTTEGYLVTAGTADARVATAGKPGAPILPGASVCLSDRERSPSQLWRVELGPSLAKVKIVPGGGNAIKGTNRVFYVDSRPLTIDGYLSGLQFGLIGSGALVYEGFVLQLTAFVSASPSLDGTTPRRAAFNDGPNDDKRLALYDGGIFADLNLLYLPAGPIHELKIDRKQNSNRIALMLRTSDGAPWVYADDETTSTRSRELLNLVVDDGLAKVDPGYRAIGIGFYQDADRLALQLSTIPR